MLRKAAESRADHVFCDLEDSVAPSEKVAARSKICWALNNLDWGKKTRCVRINDVTTEWCYGDIIAVMEEAGQNLDTIMLTKPYSTADVLFVDRLLNQLEKKLGMKRRIGIEVLIEEVQALQNVEDIAKCTDRMESLILGTGDYSASQGMDMLAIGGQKDYPGDIFHFARFRMTMAARAAGIDAIDGPYGNLKNETGYRTEALMARSLGMVGKWALHPSQIEPALDVFSPSKEEIERARRMEAAYLDAETRGVGAVQIDGQMIDVAIMRYVRIILEKAKLYGL
jgi:citrate lyase subunit beta/citryl-CoA lyase